MPANIRINVKAPFPALVEGSGAVAVSKSNGIWTIELDYESLAALLASADLPAALIAIYDPVTQQFNTVTAAEVAALGINAYRFYPAAGPVEVLTSDTVILLNDNTPPPANIVLPTSQSRNGIPVTIKDYAGQASAANPYTFVPATNETIDGFSAAQSAANGVALISIAYGKKTLYPLTSGGWYL